MSGQAQHRRGNDDRHYLRGWKRIAAILSPFVALATLSALVLPAVTMNKSECPLAEHQHTELCYSPGPQILVCSEETLGLHHHEASCYDKSGAVICGFADFAVHQHSADCYDESGSPVCSLPELEAHMHDASCWDIQDADPGHSHSDSCYTWVTSQLPACGLEEGEAHVHTEACYPLERGELVCTQTERPATDPSATLTCKKQEILLHTHTQACYITEEALKETDDSEILERVRQLQEAGASGPQYLLCTQTEVLEHRHGESCFTAGEPVLTCQLPEHVHSDQCRKVAVTAGESMTEAAGVVTLIADLPELTQIEASLSEKSDEERQVYKQNITGQISAALNAYLALDETEKALVSNLERLAEYTYLVAPDAATRDVILQLADLPTVEALQEEYAACSAIQRPVYTNNLTVRLTAVKDSYNALTPEQQAIVLSIYRLTELEEYLIGLATPEGSLEFAADGYTTTVIAPAEAMLPEDTVVTARSVLEFNKTPARRAVTKDDSGYTAQIEAAITWGEVTKIRLYNITLISGDSEVQPSVPVEVRTEFTEPLEISGDEVVYGVHFGDNGLELLPAETERDGSGSIVAITHTQSSFSTTGYVLVHVSNPNDVGPDTLPVHYCIWVNDQWIIAGSTRTGWYGSYDPQEEWPPEDDQRDYITLTQMASVLGDYGLDITDHEEIQRTVWYQRAENDGKTIRHDTAPVQKTVNGKQEWVYLLSGNKVKDDGYHIYYVPAGTLSGNENNPESTYDSNAALSADLKQESKFCSLEVRDMNQVVYGPDEELPAVQYARYGQSVSVTVKANIQNGVNAGWQWVNSQGNVVHGIDRLLNGEPDDRFTYTDNGDGTETYGFSGILGRTTLIPYSTAVDGAASDKTHMIELTVYVDGRWQNVGHISLQYKKEDICQPTRDDGTVGEAEWFVTAGQLYTYLKDFGFSPVGYSPDDISNNYHKFTYGEGLFSQLEETQDMEMFVCNNNEKIDSSTFAVGLGSTQARDLTLFYLPGSDHESFEHVQGRGAKEYASVEEDIRGDRFFSVTVKDDYQLVYYGYETDAFHIYVQEGDSVDVSVQNAQSVLWSVRELWKDDPEHPDYTDCEYTASQADNFNTYHFQQISGPIQIEASSLNPTYTVQYYADIVTYDLFTEAQTVGKDENSLLEVINTKGKNLPENNTQNPTLFLQLEKTDILSTENRGANDYKYQVYQDIKSQPIYTQKQFQYDKSHLWKNIDKLWNNTSYEILRIGILKDGMDPESQDVNDWWVYNCRDNGANITFTNVAAEENAPHKEGQEVMPADQDYTILLTEGMVVRLHYTLMEDDQQISNVKFFDYDITAGGTAPYDSGIEGINDRSNYPASTPLHGSNATGTNISNIYAFGNVNCGTGLASARLNKGVYINRYNNSVTYGCAFGLVNSSLSNGTLQWNVYAPDIFGESGTIKEGRFDYTGSLTFKKWGDVYVLSSANSTVGSRSGLEYLFHPSPTSGTIYNGTNGNKNIFTNDFWIVEDATNRYDPNWGEYGKHIYFNSRSDSAEADKLGGKTNSSDRFFPVSDDGRNHNSFFGMKFAVDFSISEDYIGPLSYVFFGDDDMWVYLDGQLVCDIGGVHSSVGEYVDLRDYLPVDGPNTVGTHTLTFYYTERGSSGSTCWMSFTLPSMTSSIVEQGTSQIQIAKTLTDMSDRELVSTEEYEFAVQLYENAEKKVLLNEAFSLVIEKADGAVEYYSVSTGQTILIGAGDKATIYGVPIGTYYVVEEAQDDRFNVVVNGKEGYVAEGTVGNAVNFADFTNVQIGYMLPDTGGPGPLLYTLGGLSLMSVAVLLYSSKRKRRKEEK